MPINSCARHVGAKHQASAANDFQDMHNIGHANATDMYHVMLLPLAESLLEGCSLQADEDG